MTASGHLYLPAQSKAYQSHLERLEDRGLIIRSADLQEDLTFSTDEYQLENYIQGLPQQIRFADGSLFVADQSSRQTLDHWFAASRADRSLSWWESHWLALVLAVLLTPVVIWWIMVQGVPMAAHASVRFFPSFVGQQIGDQTLTLLDKYELTASALPPDQIEAITENWQTALLDLDLPSSEFKLLFRQSELFKANAFALPNHTIVITDSLVHLLENQPDAILAILLHETGHIVHQHGLKSLAESFAITLAVTFLLGDVDSTGDTFISLGSGIVNNAFSRDLEREADQFALTSLQQLGLSTESFADAMKSLTKHHGQEEQESPWYKKIFSTHPDTMERIQTRQQD